jgi:predicted CXXCH cytochrome family protein
MCVGCHVLTTTDKVLHGPYREGLCVACHSPHASDFPAHTWASAQDTCMGCHTRRLKVDEAKQTVTTPWGQTLTFAQMKGWQYLNLDATETRNHPVEGHPVSGPNTAPILGSVTCLSCHRPHGSNYANLLPVGPLPSMPDCRNCGLCKQCHATMY